MKQFYLFLLILITVSSYGQVPNAFILLDNFNRNDSVKVGVPAGSTYEYWLEYGEINFGCEGPRNIRIHNNAFEMSRFDLNGNGCFNNSAKAANIEMTFKYSTIFANSPGQLEWYFNMQQSLADPTGFGSGKDGVAFVVGCNLSDPTSGSPKGYAVVFGDGTTDGVRLVSFTSSFSTASFTDIVTVAGPAVKTDHMSIRVTFNPCTSEWSLRMRDDGAAFADPSTISGNPLAGETAVNSTFTAMNLPWIGGILSHSTANIVAKYDNVYIPNSATVGTYTWNGGTNTDFQNALNWTPARSCVNASDRLLFNSLSPATSVVTNIPSQSLRQLWVTDNRAVTLKDISNAVTNTFTITGGAGADLYIESGSSLLLDVTGTAQDGMILNLATGSTASISGNLVFENTAGSGSNPHRLLAADANAVTVNNGGAIKALHLSGNPFGNTGTAGVILFSAGAVYESHDGLDPFGLVVPSSKVIFNRGSVYRHFANSQPSLHGRTYANFEFDGNVNVTAGSNSSVLTVDTLTILNGTLQFTGSGNGEGINTNIKGDLVVNAGAVFNYDPVAAGTLTFNGTFAAQKITRNGTLTLGRELTLKLSSSYATPQLSIENDISIAGILHIALGTLHLNANITMLSDAIRTASVTTITGNISYANGRFVVERFIPAHKAWQFLAVPTTTGQTIKDAWQEGNSPLANLNPGYGTIITSNIAGNGFDILTPAGPSMKYYNSVTNNWVGTATTDTDPIANKKGYMLLVRGDRSVTTSNALPTSTILRTTGKIFSPGVNAPPYTTVVAGKFESIGNPYASAIDFNLVTKTGGVQNTFYVWDPQLTGGVSAYGLGAIQTFLFNGTSYDVVPGGGSYAGTNRYIESGQAFFARCTSPNGNITFTESCKVNASSLVTRGGFEPEDQLRTNLYVVYNNQPVLLDGVIAQFNNGNDNAVNEDDVYKMPVAGESIALFRNDSMLVAEKRNVVDNTDTLFYKLDHLRQQQYQLRFMRKHLIDQGVEIYIVDRWLGSKTIVPATDTVVVFFTVTAEPGSAASDRFYLVLNKAVVPSIDKPAFSIQPNPVEGKMLNVIFNDAPAASYIFRISDAAGKVVIGFQRNISGNQGRISFPLSQLPSGIYNLLISGPQQTTLRFIIP